MAQGGSQAENSSFLQRLHLENAKKEGMSTDRRLSTQASSPSLFGLPALHALSREVIKVKVEKLKTDASDTAITSDRSTSEAFIKKPRNLFGPKLSQGNVMITEPRRLLMRGLKPDNGDTEKRNPEGEYDMKPQVRIFRGTQDSNTSFRSITHAGLTDSKKQSNQSPMSPSSRASEFAGFRSKTTRASSESGETKITLLVRVRKDKSGGLEYVDANGNKISAKHPKLGALLFPSPANTTRVSNWGGNPPVKQSNELKLFTVASQRDTINESLYMDLKGEEPESATLHRIKKVMSEHPHKHNRLPGAELVVSKTSTEFPMKADEPMILDQNRMPAGGLNTNLSPSDKLKRFSSFNNAVAVHNEMARSRYEVGSALRSLISQRGPGRLFEITGPNSQQRFAYLPKDDNYDAAFSIPRHMSSSNPTNEELKGLVKPITITEIENKTFEGGNDTDGKNLDAMLTSPFVAGNLLESEILLQEEILLCYELFAALYHLYYFYRNAYQDLCRELKLLIETVPLSYSFRNLKRIILADFDCAISLECLRPQYLFDALFLGTKNGELLDDLVKQYSQQQEMRKQLDQNRKLATVNPGSRLKNGNSTGSRNTKIMNAKKLVKWGTFNELADMLVNSEVTGLGLYLTPGFAYQRNETLRNYRKRQESAFMTSLTNFTAYNPIKVKTLNPNERDHSLVKQYKSLAASIYDHLRGMRYSNLNHLMEYIKENFRPNIFTVGIVEQINIPRPLDTFVADLGPNGLYGKDIDCKLTSKMEWDINMKYREVAQDIRRNLYLEKDRETFRRMTARGKQPGAKPILVSDAANL